MLGDDSAIVRAAVVQALWDEPAMRATLRPVLSALLLSGDEPDVHRAAITVCHLVGDCPEPSVLQRMLSSQDPVTRVLAGAGVVRFGADPSLKEDAISIMCSTMADDLNTQLLQREIVPLLPDFGEEAVDGIVLAAAGLPEQERARVARVLGGVHEVMNNRMSLREIMPSATLSGA